MFEKILKWTSLFALLQMLAAEPALAQSLVAARPDLPLVQGSALVPGGWFGFCLADAGACPAPVRASQALAVTDATQTAFDRLGAAASFEVKAVDSADVPDAPYMTVGNPTFVPYGWFDFCGRRPEACKVKPLAPQDVPLTQDTWALLEKINQTANATIKPVSNLDHWGTRLDHWDYPTDGKGDCKIYALYKRKLLLEAGLPRQALLITIVRDLAGDGHTILTIRTDHGEFVLDNLTNDIRAWDMTGYQFLKRQAQADPNVWLDLHGVRGMRADVVASATAPGTVLH